MSSIRSVLLAGKFRTQHELNGMSNNDQRNTLIVELNNHSNQPIAHFGAMDDSTLAGTGAVLVFIRAGQIRNDDELKSMSDTDQRNTLIVELDLHTHLGIPQLQGFSNMQLVLLGLGNDNSFIRSVLLAGMFRTQNELNSMSHDDQRNTLIVELNKHSNQPISYFGAMDDSTLAGTGAVLVFIRAGQIRSDDELKSMSDTDQRNTLIVELDLQTHLGIPQLQGFSNMQLIRAGLGSFIDIPTAAIDSGSLVWQDIIVTGGLAALGGNYQITFFQNGNFVFKGHMHNSGSDNYDSQLAVAIVDGLGNAYTLEYKGYTDGNVPIIEGDHHSDDWENKGNNPAIALNWEQLQVARYSRIFNYDSQIGDAVNQAVNAALQAAAKAAATAIIALV